MGAGRFTTLALTGLLACIGPGPTCADDRTDVTAAVLDYVEGIYEADSTRATRSVDPRLAKLGLLRGAGGYEQKPMSFSELRAATATFNKDRHIPPGAPREVTILDILDQTASVKLVAAWGVDYIHLARLDGRWVIVHVLWQSTPPAQ